jgi:hypothetical protein
MNKLLNINGKDYSFTYSETSSVWMGKLVIENHDISIEICSEEFDPLEFETFINFIEGRSLLSELTPKIEGLLKNYIDIVRFGIEGDINKYSFRLEAIFYHGRKSSLIFEKAFKYSLFFKLYHEKYMECDDPYGLYLADIENALIIGIRREQV